MTEREWMECNDPREMLQHVLATLDNRKVFFLASAWGRRLTIQLESMADGWRSWLQMVEQIAQGKEIPAEYQEARALVATSLDRSCIDGVGAIYELICGDIPASKDPFDELEQAASDFSAEAAVQAHLLRDVVGNPFRPVSFDHAWRSPAVTELAASIDKDYGFEKMPLLADALEAAGCRDEEILSHCCSLQEHVHGCWVIDRLLHESRSTTSSAA